MEGFLGCVGLGGGAGQGVWVSRRRGGGLCWGGAAGATGGGGAQPTTAQQDLLVSTPLPPQLPHVLHYGKVSPGAQVLVFHVVYIYLYIKKEGTANFH